MTHYFEGKSAAVTGAGDGIGRALAMQLNAEGCALWLCDISDERLQATYSQLDAQSAPVHLRVVDCGDKQAIDAWVDEISQHTQAIDAVFNNAGVAYSALFEDATEDNYQWLMGVNFWGVVWSWRLSCRC